MNNTTYYIFRHGQTIETYTKTPYGENILTSDLIPQGKSAISRLGDYLKNREPQANFSSPLPRCKSTVKIIEKKLTNKFIFDNRLTEYYNETFYKLKKRVAAFLKEIEIQNYQSVSICTHGAIIAAVTHLVIDRYLSVAHLLKFPDPGILRIIKNGKVEEVNFN